MVIGNKNMGCFNHVIVIFICLFWLANLLITIQFTTAQPDYVYHFCLGDNYTTNSTFQKNLNLLLSSLSSADLSIIDNGYYNTTVGRNPDTIYGSLQCRGDVSLEDCQSCVKTGTEDINTNGRCPNSKQAIIYYDVCMLRYSNWYYFNIMQDRPGVYLWNMNNISSPNQFRPVLAKLLIDIAGEVETKTDPTNFATGVRSFDNSIKVYGLVQCIADIPSSSCFQCLFGAITEIPDCCDGKRGGRVIRPSCNWRYEIYPFFESPSIPPLPPLLVSPPPPLTNTTAPNAKGNNSSKLAISIVVPSAITILFAIGFWWFCFRRKKSKTKKSYYVDDEIPSSESLQFNFGVVSAATDNFSEANKLGEGGFGSVYKGTLSDSWQEIAVKRLSKNSGQGEQEFKNEVTLVAKLQHRNLVKLVGFSLAGEEKLLIYEYMPNGSLDQILFDPIKCTQLDWERRYKIIGGIARGLVYLHEESRLKVVHRDLKASNILLDSEMNPKIADFGMARLFGLDQIQDNTNRIVGTYGYMAPEYIMHGEFSVKSDVFSFGVLVLEILCGQKNSSFHKSDIARDLLSYAWRHWNNRSAVEILDPILKDTCSGNEAVKCIHVALLCVQENAADRPAMPTVVQMLNSYSGTNPDLPLAPAFFAGSTRHMEPNRSLFLGYSGEQGSSKNESTTDAATWSVSEVTVTEINPR
ncbi:putative receptor-like protein kinase At4g00960 isoform X1 [Papaver somniferum]|uniref:putative receptor-like protein kinase At4g00960 isoform X1 n=2 Tax=Papaver somniferum TaxID=3469 RepID=UPI000E6FCCAE|nr:putative receptor-like protein kinase At4g00960 isoform X1 [Papaver somniferum]